MYLHLGEDVVIRTENIIGIFDLDASTLSYKTRDFLSQAEKKGQVISVSPDIPKSFVLCQENDQFKIYVCQASPATLIKRAGIHT